MIAILIYTAVHAGAVASLRLRDYRSDGTQFTLRFLENGSKSREIIVRYDLECYLNEYLLADGLEFGRGDLPIFRAARLRTKSLTETAISSEDICGMLKRRLKAVGLPLHLSPHSSRVTTITDLLDPRGYP